MGDPDWNLVRLGFDVFQALIVAAVTVYLWVDRHSRVTADRLARVEADVDARLDGHEARLSVVEAECRHFPSHNDLAAVYEKMNSVAEKVDTLVGTSRATTRQLEMIQQHLLQGGE